MRSPHVLIVVNVDWFFWSHRLTLAKAAQEAGCRVTVAAGVERGYDEAIRREGLRFVPLDLDRSSRAIGRELTSIRSLVRLYRWEKPDLVHHVTIKPVLYGSLAARLSRVPAVVNAISGLGYMFSAGSRTGRLREYAASAAYRLALGGDNTRVIFQNREDRALFLERGLVPERRTVLIRGSGVDLSRYTATPEPDGIPTVLLASRLIWDKGIGDLVEAGRRLKSRGRKFRLVLVGLPDTANPNSIPIEDIQRWQQEGVAEWWGQRDDMPEVMRMANIVTLPTFYREGVPKVLLEAAAAGRPIITTDAPGCREVVRHGENGLLVPARDPAALTEALDRLISDPGLRQRMGLRSREIAEAEFGERQVIDQTLTLYRELLGALWPVHV